MKYNNDFKYDLEVGNLAEKEIGELLQSGHKIEVKKDLQAHSTGNVFVEYKSRNKPSGIATSLAEWYAFYLEPQIVFIKTEALKIKCRKYLGKRRDIAGGDSNTSKGILLPLKELIEK
jgi:hypothetical protein